MIQKSCTRQYVGSPIIYIPVGDRRICHGTFIFGAMQARKNWYRSASKIQSSLTQAPRSFGDGVSGGRVIRWKVQLVTTLRRIAFAIVVIVVIIIVVTIIIMIIIIIIIIIIVLVSIIIATANISSIPFHLKAYMTRIVNL